jgi:hypothetical protein
MSKNRTVRGPDGTSITLADLPSRDTKRWVIRKKAIVVSAVEGGLITISDACERYSLSLDEYLGWVRALKKHGLPGLRSTKTQHYRNGKG